VRPELSTAGPPGLERPPLANIPPPGVAVPPRRESRSVPSGKGLSLLAPDGDSRELPAGKPVLVEFLTTTCLPCKKAAPVIAGLQRRYGLKGLEVVGVVCDEADTAARQSLAARHQRQGRLNYLLYVEPEDRPGALGKRFGVTAYPTLVLLDAGGAVRWHGHPNEAAELEQAIREVLPR
jgi:thiol-disulfide isomerase/thioredoxin